MQEVYILALKNIGKLNDPTVFIAWLNRICFHVCYDMTQKNRPQNDCQVLSQEILDILRVISSGCQSGTALPTEG